MLERIRGDDEDAWRRLVQLYTPLVHHWCRRGGVQEGDADDLVQEVFQAVTTGLGKFHRDRPGDTFRGWLRGITRNIVLAFHRRVSRQPRASGGTDALARIHEVADTEPGEVEDPSAEVASLYQRALELVRSEFEERTWHMFAQVAVENRSPADVAAELNVTPAAVRQAKSRVLRRLKVEVGDLID